MIYIRYCCPKCGECWEEEGDCACDAECGQCGCENITALQFREQEKKWSTKQQKQWVKSLVLMTSRKARRHD